MTLATRLIGIDAGACAPTSVMPRSPKSPSATLSQNPLSIRLYKVLAANFDDDATKEALDTLAELYAPPPSAVPGAKAKGKEVKRDKADHDDDEDGDVLEEDAVTSVKPVNGDAAPLVEAVPGEIAANARKNLRRDVESKLAESSRRFLTAFAEVDKVCRSCALGCIACQSSPSNSIPCKSILASCATAVMKPRRNCMRPMRRASPYLIVLEACVNKGIYTLYFIQAIPEHIVS